MRGKRFKRLLLGVTTVYTIFACSMSVTAAEFTDVKSGDWFHDYVESVSSKGFMTGYSDGRFGPYDKLTRGQFATILYRNDGSPDTAFEWGVYSDVEDGKFYSTPAVWGKYSGILTGYSDGRFGPDDNITREQIATILYRAEGSPSVDENIIYSYPDGGSVSPFAKSPMAWAVGEDIIKGNNGSLIPLGNATRAECAAILERYSNSDTSSNPSGDGNNDKPSKPSEPETPGGSSGDNSGGSTDDSDCDEQYALLRDRNKILDGLTYGRLQYPVVAPDEGIDWDNAYSWHYWSSKDQNWTGCHSWDGDLEGVLPPNEFGGPLWRWTSDAPEISFWDWMYDNYELTYYYVLHDPYVRESHKRLGIDYPYHEDFLIAQEDISISEEEYRNHQLSSNAAHVTLSDVTVPPAEGAVLYRVFEDGYSEEYDGGFIISYDVYGGTNQWGNYMGSGIDSQSTDHGTSNLYWRMRE